MKKLFLLFSVTFAAFFLATTQTTPYADMLDQRNKILGIAPAPKPTPIPAPAPIIKTELTLLANDLTDLNKNITNLSAELHRLDQQAL